MYICKCKNIYTVTKELPEVHHPSNTYCPAISTIIEGDSVLSLKVFHLEGRTDISFRRHPSCLSFCSIESNSSKERSSRIVSTRDIRIGIGTERLLVKSLARRDLRMRNSPNFSVYRRNRSPLARNLDRLGSLAPKESPKTGMARTFACIHRGPRRILSIRRPRRRPVAEDRETFVRSLPVDHSLN